MTARGTGIDKPSEAPKIGLPPRVFLYTLDQIALMLDLPVQTVTTSYIYFEGRSIGRKGNELMIARNIAPDDQKPEWRVPEREFVRWMKTKGFRYYERGAVSS
ncbi:MAG TPA: hypothetical protein VIY48_18200 [Candidatus Paceibacterota bacterium]|jgi:hypothetical protein